MIVPRTCTEISAGNEDQHQEKESRPLEAFRDAPAYVLLGDPGAGKTTAFEAECEALGEKACLITARDFLTFDPQYHPEWHDKTLFIDGLDEIRVSANDARTPFNQIRGRLDALGKPHFRLSCREADWLGTNDQNHLESVSPDSKVTVLRLNPLTDSDIADILNDRPDIGDAQEFIALAQEQRVDGLLKNPQTLNMLVDVVAQGGGWPKSRKETFEMACGQMIREHNEEHQAAQESNTPPTPDQLLDAAGRLCAVQLISGKAGFTLRGQADGGYPALDQYGYDSPEILRYTLATKLFKGVSNNRFAPVHRHIAEFLGARYLAGIINSGLPVRRVIALIEGKDGTVVTEMRGLSAWLAAHCEKARSDLIKRDPIGVGLYGDIREFSTDEKRALLKCLNREASRLDSAFLKTTAFGALATPDMEPALKAILSDSNRDRDHQMFTGFVLRFLREGGPLPNLSELLLEIVRDDTRRSNSNALALDAFIHSCPNSLDKTDKLKALLTDIRTGSISDPHNELFGVLLIQLYPQEVPPSEVWNCLSEKGNSEFFGRYWRFWATELLKRSSDEQVVELLDNLQQRLPHLQSALDGRSLDDLPLNLLARGLKAHGDQLDTERLYDWLDVGFKENQDRFRGFSKEAISEIRSWLDQRPEVQKAVVLEGLSRWPQADEFRWPANVRNRLYDASLPSDFGFWCLKQAVTMADTKPQVAEYLFEWAWAVWSERNRSVNEGLSIEILQEHAQRNETLEAYLNRRLAPPSISPRQQERRERDRRYAEERRQEEEQWLEYVRSNEAVLRENRAAPYLLCQVAIRYFGDAINVRIPGGSKDIEQELRDPSLIDAVRLGIRGVIDREDVPDVEEILTLRAKNPMHSLGWPFLAALMEIERTASEEICRLTEKQMHKALTFHYWLSSSKEPNWYRRLLDFRPEIVSEVLVQYGKSELRGGSDHIPGLFALAHRRAHAQVAKHASLPLLRAFPIRCKLKQTEDLDYLFWAAIQYADRVSLQELIEKKLSRKSMNDAQRVHWLAAGIIVSPRTYNDLLRDFAEGRERRIRSLAEFFYLEHSSTQFSIDELGIASLELLIRLVGSYVGSDQLKAEGRVTPEMQASHLVNDLIQRLAASPSKDASDALDRLLADPAPSRWRDVLSRAQDAQQVTWRDASYCHPTIEQVCQTLNGGTPANAADLAALLVDRFDEIADRIRMNNANYWRPYWNEDKNQKPINPKHENSCRDALLHDLRLYFPNAEPEVKSVNDKRADIRVSYGDFQVPVEIKRNMNRDLWSALRNQLIAQYTIDLDTDGYGIYLVFWFGEIDGCRTQPPPTGTRPANSKELKKRLEATLSPDEARKISICVIDVSRPD
ncbi:MAG: hypothetical protein OXH63_02325 [Gemmatimonadetes bacterium]|nr:hypothetical protein [Gemmatimonadota bacterium]